MGSPIVGLSIAMLLMPPNLLIRQCTTLAVAAYMLVGLGLAFHATTLTDAALSNVPDDQAGAICGAFMSLSSVSVIVDALRLRTAQL